MFPEVDSITAARLRQAADALTPLQQNWRRHGGVMWTPGMILSPEISSRFDSFIPWQECCRLIHWAFRQWLPNESWMPRMLQHNTYRSLLEFWQELPQWQGKIIPEPSQALEFLCLCADPPRFGTDIGRYPAQLQRLATLPPPRRLLDLGCGVGLGTLECAHALGADNTVGVTLEPLEAWMAQQRWLPHDPGRTKNFTPFAGVKADFLAMDILDYEGEAPFDGIICNGLAGGRFMDSPVQLRRFMQALQTNLSLDGWVAMANSFHEGRRDGMERLIRMAAEMGWSIAGDWRELIIRPPKSRP